MFDLVAKFYILLQERDKQYLSKAIVSELVQAIKFKCDMHEQNYMTIVEIILQDAGEEVSQEVADDQVSSHVPPDVNLNIGHVLVLKYPLKYSSKANINASKCFDCFSLFSFFDFRRGFCIQKWEKAFPVVKPYRNSHFCTFINQNCPFSFELSNFELFCNAFLS